MPSVADRLRDETLAEVAALLVAQSIPHALVDAAALAVRGVARSKVDIDLLTTSAPSTLSSDATHGKHAPSHVQNSPPTARPPSTAVDLILLELYAGGTQDLWDVRERLRSAAAQAWLEFVEADLGPVPVSMRNARCSALEVLKARGLLLERA